MARRLGRLWRSGARRAEVSEPPETDGQDEDSRPEEMGRRLEEARLRLRQTIAPPEDADPEGSTSPPQT